MAFEYDDPIIYELRSGKVGDEYHQYTDVPYKVNTGGIVILNEIPVREDMVQVKDTSTDPDTNYFEIKNGSPSTLQYYVDYLTGRVQFNDAAIGKTLAVTFKGRGGASIPSTRVYTDTDNNGQIAQTLDDVIKTAADFTHKGSYNNATDYNAYNLVSYEGGTYMATASTVGHLPTDTTYWKKLTGFQWRETYDSGATYNGGDGVVNATGDILYVSIIDDNTNQSLLDTAKWTPLIDVSGIVDTLNTTNTNVQNDEDARVTAEDTRVSQESARVTAESNRVTAESGRINAESTRVSQETTRQSNESTRQSNETTRQSQEEAREVNTQNAIDGLNDAVSEVIHKGAYVAGTAYKVNNSVSYNGSTYRCILDSTGNLPTDTTYWELEASKGTDGNIVDVDNKIGDLSDLITTDKTSIVHAINEVDAQIVASSATPVTLAHGLNVIDVSSASSVDLTIGGCTRVNLLGGLGNGESNTTWLQSVGGSLSYTTDADFGSRAFLVSTSSGPSGVGTINPIAIDPTKYYLLVASIKAADAQDSRVVITKGSLPVSYSNKIAETLAYNDATRYRKGYAKISPSDLVGETSIHLYMRVVKNPDLTPTTAKFDGLALYEIDAAMYAKIDVDPEYSGDKLADKYPYVDGVQSLKGVMLTKPGKNLLGPFTEWTDLGGTAKNSINLPYELGVTGTGGIREIYVECLPNQQMTFRGVSSDQANIKYIIYTHDANKTQIASKGAQSSNDYTLTFSTESNAKYVRVLIYGYGTGVATMSTPQLELGSTATAFEPQNNDYMYAPVTLASSVDGMVKDTLTYRDGAWRKLSRWVTDVVLDGSPGWAFITDATSFKRVRISNSNFIGIMPTSLNLTGIKYNGYPLKSDGSATAPDQINIGSTDTFITISDTESGWTESLNPLTNAIKAFMNGWKANADNGTVYTSWESILDGSAPDTNTEAYVAANKAPGWTGWATLSYQRAQAEEEVVTVEGAISWHSGSNQVQVLEGVVVREVANPVAVGTTYRINDTFAGSASKLSKNVDKFVAVYRNNILDNKWTFDTSNPYGKQRAFIQATDYDDTAEYTVTYIALDRYAMTAPCIDVSGTYASTIKDRLDDTVARLTDVETTVTINVNQLINILARLKAAGI